MNKLPSSFRDPAGFMFSVEGVVHRQINQVAKADYDLLMTSGLYDYLVKKELLIAHSEVQNVNEAAYKTIRPNQISFISYPYEWSFEQLKDAALLTLRIQKVALKHGMSLKDASAYSIQFVNGKPTFIDTLSFENYEEGKPWDAYRQFCQHFLAPLALASYKDIRLTKLLSDFIDGIPLDLAAQLLPKRTLLKFSLASHIHWHAKAQGKHADKATDQRKRAQISKTGLLGIIDNLKSAINKLKWNAGDTEWGDYYNNTNYSDSSFEEKKTIIGSFLKETQANSLWDLGANDGTFSSIGSEMGIDTIAFDIDPIAVNKNYIRIRKEKTTKMLPLLMDLTNPSADLGWGHKERDGLQTRGKADCIMALALIHHLAISNNLPLNLVAEYFSKLGNHLIIEFVPKTDSKVKTLLATRKDIFPDYTTEGFEKAFEIRYAQIRKQQIAGSDRILYLYRTK
ncbi:MAG: class I SAM-dependent methyltransferase [Flavobacteriales bacterium]|nr:class I SAM-dependent methyltransferase [Flavobacteriales bacterium]